MSDLQSMETAPKDGTPVRLFGKYLPDCGRVHIWQFHPGTGVTGWTTAQGLACFEWSGWKTVSDDVAYAIAAEREACAIIAEGLSLTINGLTHGAWDRGYNAGRREAAAAIRARGTT